MTDNVLTYKGYSTRVQYSVEDRVLYGRIEGIADLVNFECETVGEVEGAFHEAVDDYLAFCADVGQSPDKEYKGSFNVRVKPGLHRSLDQEAARRGISMNQYIESALERQVALDRSSAPYQTAVVNPAMIASQNSVHEAWMDEEKESGNIIPFPAGSASWVEERKGGLKIDQVL